MASEKLVFLQKPFLLESVISIINLFITKYFLLRFALN